MKDLPTSFSCRILQDLPNENHKTNYTNAKEVLEELELAGKEIRLRFSLAWFCEGSFEQHLSHRHRCQQEVPQPHEGPMPLHHQVTAQRASRRRILHSSKHVPGIGSHRELGA